MVLSEQKFETLSECNLSNNFHDLSVTYGGVCICSCIISILVLVAPWKLSPMFVFHTYLHVRSRSSFAFVDQVSNVPILRWVYMVKPFRQTGLRKPVYLSEK